MDSTPQETPQLGDLSPGFLVSDILLKPTLCPVKSSLFVKCYLETVNPVDRREKGQLYLTGEIIYTNDLCVCVCVCACVCVRVCAIS